MHSLGVQSVQGFVWVIEERCVLGMSLQRKEKCLVLLGFTGSAHEVENTTKTRQSTQEEKKEMKTA